MVLNKNCFYSTTSYGADETKDNFVYNEKSKKFELSYRQLKKFDQHKNLIKTTYYDYDLEPYRIETISYNDKNQKVKMITQEHPKDLEQSWVFNKEGDILKSIFNNGRGHTYTYKYDKHGNWIEKTVKSTEGGDKGRDVELIERTIVYY